MHATRNRINHTEKDLGRPGAAGRGIPNYFSERLLRKLDVFARSKAAIVEAPTGYGKTTAMRNYLKRATAHGEKVFWFNSVDEAPVALYRRLCREIEKIDGQAGAQLQEIDFPNAFTIGEVCDVFRSIECDAITWLIIDDFHFLLKALPMSTLVALLSHDKANLHIVVLTQQTGQDFRSAVASIGIPDIDATDLQWDAGDILRYFDMAGEEISFDTAVEIEKNTNGWAIAIHLQLCAWMETGALSNKAVYQLMEQLIWNRMSKEQQTFFMKVSPFISGTTSQLCAMLGCDKLPDYAIESLSIPFVRYIAEGQRYEAYSVLHELISNKRREAGEDFDRDCLRKAGDLCRDEGQIAEALEFYAQIKDYSRILSLDLSGFICAEFGGKTFYDIALNILDHCPEEIRSEHPHSMLCLAWAIRQMDNHSVFKELMKTLDGTLPKTGVLRAEWQLLSVYLHFPKLDKMLSAALEAADMFDGKISTVILPQAPWAIYEYLQVTAFHLTPGAADMEADLLERFLDIYSKLTDGHGKGADALFRAELAFLRCETAKAEIYAYKAAFLAERKKQKIIQIGAVRLLGVIAILKADSKGWQQALSALENAAHGSTQNTELFRAVLDVVRGTLLAELRDFSRLEQWLQDYDSGNNRPMPESLEKNARGVNGLHLIGKLDFAQLIGRGQANTRDNFTAYTEHVFFLMMASGCALLGDKEQAERYLRISAEKALPDGFIHYFAGFSPLLQGLADALIENEYPQLAAKFNEYKEQYIAGWKTLHNAIVENELPSGLTERELEVAELAADGLRNHEIAEMLYVSENTVRAHLRSIYQKLDIDRRAKLARALK
ncbi:MAG: LuxR C-terminal-related transcriptional regulator [Oscillospiraceae bacterium]|nr:LuxR C-terminal-related transcriptional regulator [Oscillospiraceae bacterium]